MARCSTAAVQPTKSFLRCSAAAPIAFVPDIQTDLRVGAGLKPAPCMICSQGLTGMVETRMLRSVPGKPSAPEASSFHVDWLPALFAHAEEYPRPWALPVSLHTQGR